MPQQHTNAAYGNPAALASCANLVSFKLYTASATTKSGRVSPSCYFYNACALSLFCTTSVQFKIFYCQLIISTLAMVFFYGILYNKIKRKTVLVLKGALYEPFSPALFFRSG